MATGSHANEPYGGKFNDPAARQQREAFNLWRPLDDSIVQRPQWESA